MGIGALIISLDFELLWGLHDIYTPNDYGKSNVRQVRQVVYSMLELFNKYDVHVTFATVGLIFCQNKVEALKLKPERIPSYINIDLGAYKSSYISNIKPEEEELYFGLDIIENLKKEKNIEIASHTFSHYYCWEKGQTIQEFESDLKSMQLICKKHDVECRSIVFPRNMVSNDYLNICTRYGIVSYRGNPKVFFEQKNSLLGTMKSRLLRFIDCYVNISGYNSYPFSDIDLSKFPVNIKASRFLQPYNKRLRLFESLKLLRIKKEIEYAAKNHEIYHLWWHPHNFGCNIEENMNLLEKILQFYSYCRDKYKMKSFTMNECKDYIMKNYEK